MDEPQAAVVLLAIGAVWVLGVPPLMGWFYRAAESALPETARAVGLPGFVQFARAFAVALWAGLVLALIVDSALPVIAAVTLVLLIGYIAGTRRAHRERRGHLP